MSRPDVIAVRLLGAFAVSAGSGRQIARPGRRSMALIACLAAEPRRVWNRDRLARLLWADRGKDQARASLRQELVRLRSCLGAIPFAVDGAGGGLRLDTTGFDVDVVQFEAAVDGSRWHDAAALYGGAFLEDCQADGGPFGEWLLAHRQRLRDAASHCLVQQLRRADRQDDHVRAVRIVEQLVSIDPSSEEARRWLMRRHAPCRTATGAPARFCGGGNALEMRFGAEASAEACALVREFALTWRSQPSSAAPDDRADTPGCTTWTRAGDLAPPAEDRRSIAVLPFVDLSAEDRDEALGDGLTEETIGAIARMPGFAVIARHTTMAYKGAAVDVRRLATELGVRYVIEGSIRRDGKRLRAHMRLIDGQTGFNVCAQSFNRRSSDLMSVGETFVREAVMRIQQSLQGAATRRALGMPCDGFAAGKWLTHFHAELHLAAE